MSEKDQNSVTLNKVIEDWAIIVIKNWQEKVIMLNINSSHALFNSFWHHVNTNANGDPDRIDFAFNYYGKFVDMGVGKGVKYTDRNNGRNRRKQNRWFSKVYYKDLVKLRELIATNYADKAAQIIVKGIEDSSIVNN